LARSGVKIRDMSNTEGQFASSYYDYNPVAIDDMLINPMDLISGDNCSLSKVEGVISPAYVNLRYREGFYPAYYQYYFKYQYWCMAFFAHGKGVSFENRWTLNNETLMKFPLIVPPLEVQKSIANFLDQKCSEIDSLSADIQSQIDILEEYKKSVIAEAVTKGLNPNVEMKDSETKWLGMIPQRWDVSKIGSVYTLRNTKVSDYDYPPLSVTMKGIVPQLETAAKTNAHDDRKLVKKGDFAINSRSDRRGSCGIADRDGSISLINTVLCPKGEMNPSYYNWLFHTVEFADEFYANGHGIVDDLWTTGWQEMKRIWIPLPPLSEQKEIADYLDTKCAEIDAIVADKKTQLKTLTEYKKSLIYEYVTGKKEVVQ
jgi:type I restriction enzyme S subunit